MDKIVIWEHGHAYQPRRVLDSIIDSSRKVRSELSITVADREVKAKNWFELMLKPGSTYDSMFEAMYKKSVDIDPITLHYLAKMNVKLFNDLLKKIKTDSLFIASSAYSHPVLPLLIDDNLFDTKINVTWGIRFFHRLLFERKKMIFFWLSECAYSLKAAKLVKEVVEEAFGEEIKLVFLLDEMQGENVDSGHIYKVMLNDEKIFTIFRCRWLSDAYAFSTDIEWILASLKSDIENRDPKIYGTMIDAETYGGAYDPQKILFFSKLRQRLREGIYTKYGKKCFDFTTIENIFDEKQICETKIADYTSWSDYSDNQMINYENTTNGVLTKKTGGLSRWTGCLRDIDGQMLKETYFIVFPWVHPYTKNRSVRVLNSIWKIAFNDLRKKGAEIVRRTVFNILSKIVGKEKIEDIIGSYESVIFEYESPTSFIERLIPSSSEVEKKALQFALKSYRYACQDSTMSCPTFWENFDTEVTWSSLSFTAGGIILAAQACYTLDDEEGVIKLANKYQELFLDFEQSFRSLVEEYSFSMELLYAQLQEICKRRGIDFEYEIAKMSSKLDPSAFEKKVGELAEKIYHSVFSTHDVSLLVTDINKQLILSKAYAIQGKPNIAKQFFTEAKFFEWKKSISSTISKYPIPVRVGVFHAKHFPNYQRLLKRPLTEIEVDTEIIIGEAHAYSP